VRAVVVVREEVLEGAEKVRAEPTPVGGRAADGVLLEQRREEGLREVSRVVRVAPAASGVDVEREPISLEQDGQRGPRRLGGGVTRGGDDAPLRGREAARPCRRFADAVRRPFLLPRENVSWADTQASGIRASIIAPATGG
jgi:hypothetical protein